MKRLMCVGLACAFAAGCSSSATNALDGGHDAGADSGSTGGAFAISDLDLGSAGSGPHDDVVAAISADGRVGIAYYSDIDEAHKRIDYLEVAADGTTRALPLAASVERVSPLAIAFDTSGNAVVAYLGNDPNTQEPIETNAPDGGIFWTESDLAIATITPAGTLTTDYAIDNGSMNTTTCGNNVSDGDTPVVGISPAIAVSGNQLLVVHRNLHHGQNPVADYGDSDLDSVVGTPGNWTRTVAVCGEDNGGSLVRAGIGQDSSIAVSGTTVVAVTGGQSDIDGTVQGLYTVNFDGTAWAHKQQLFINPALAPNDGSGPRIVANPSGGFGLAWVDMSASTVRYATSTDGLIWNTPEAVFGAGTGGWYPSLAFDPLTGAPAVAYYVCGQEPGLNTCPTSEDELSVSERRPDGTWAPLTVDPEGGEFPTLLFHGGEELVVYRALSTGGIRLARNGSP